MSVVIVCGGRDYADRHTLATALDVFHAVDPISLLIEGGARGADTLARNWAKANKIPSHTKYANWKRDGRAAGPKRNAEMLGLLIAWRNQNMVRTCVIAFPGGAGTANMVWQAEQSRFQVIKVRAST